MGVICCIRESKAALAASGWGACPECPGKDGKDIKDCKDVKDGGAPGRAWRLDCRGNAGEGRARQGGVAALARPTPGPPGRR